MRRVVIADDHPLFRAALGEAVRRVRADVEIVQASSAGDARATLEEKGGDLLLLDLHMEDSDGFAFLLSVKHAQPDLPVIVVSASDERDVVRRAALFGASGFISKAANLPDIVAGIAAVAHGDLHFPESGDDDASEAENALASLTPAQVKVLIGVRDGRLNKQIAYDMGITEATVKAHMTAILRKLGVINRTQAVLAARALEVETKAVASEERPGLSQVG